MNEICLPPDDRDPMEEAAHEDANRGAQKELIDIISRASRVLDTGDVAMLCWGCGIDERAVRPLTTRPR